MRIITREYAQFLNKSEVLLFNAFEVQHVHGDFDAICVNFVKFLVQHDKSASARKR